MTFATLLHLLTSIAMALGLILPMWPWRKSRIVTRD